MPLLIRLARRVVAWAAAPDDRASLLADLDHEFASRVHTAGSARASWWYLSQAARSIPALVGYRVGRRSRSGPRPPRPFLLTWRDIRYGARALARTPAFTLVAVTTLAVGIGASTASFTAFNAALLAPLPYPNHARLAVISETRKGSEISDSYPNFLDWRARARAFEDLASFRGLTVTLTGRGSPERIRGQIVNANLFSVLGVTPVVGRPFDATLDQPGAPKAVLLGYRLWERAFGGDPGVVGRTVSIDGSAREILGVMPNGFDFPSGIVYGAAEVYLSFGTYWDDDLRNRGSHPGLGAIGLLRPGVSLDQGRTDLAGIAAQLTAEHPETNRDIGTRVQDAVSVIVGDFSRELRTVILASLTLLVLACANVAGLTLTRTIARRRELAVRTALGANRMALARALVAEHLVLAAAGVAAGGLLAFGLTAAMRPLVTDLPRLATLTPDIRVLAFAMGAMVLTSALCSVVPLLWLGRAAMDPGLRQRGQATTGWRPRQLLVGAQVALALTLVVTAALFASSFSRMASRPGGIVAGGTLTFSLRLPEATYAEPRFVPFFDALYDRLIGSGQVVAVGSISTLPFSGSSAQAQIRRSDDASNAMRVDIATVTPGYFRAMGVVLLRGRLFNERDTVSAPAVAVVDERLAERMFPGEDAIGRRISGWLFANAEIVGVAGHVDNYGVASTGREEVYAPLAQHPRPMMTTVLRTSGDPLALAAVARTAIASLDPDLAISNVRTMDDWKGQTIAGPKLVATLSGAFGCFALVLAAIGVYGLVSYAVELRKKEAGIRMALGARRATVVRLMIGGTSMAIAVGTAVGLLGALFAGQLVRQQLFDIAPSHPGVLLSATAVLVASALVASWLPARRAGRVPLTTVLQDE
jgi:predicted permease